MSYTNPTRIRIKSLYKDNNLDTLKKNEESIPKDKRSQRREELAHRREKT